MSKPALFGRGRKRVPVWASGPVVALVAVSLTASAVALGIRVPGLGFLAPLSDPSSLDYSAGPPGGFRPLDPSFVADVLGVSFAGAEGGTFGGSPPAGFIPPAGSAVPPLVVKHGLTNDNFAQAYPVSSTPFTAETNTKQAGRESGETTQCGRNATVWYRYTAPEDSGMVADTFGSAYSLSLGVFRASGPSLAMLGCDSGTLGNAQVSFQAVKGTTYYIRIAREVGTSGGRLIVHLSPLGATSKASVRSDGGQAQGLSSLPFVSANGRYVAFDSDARNIVPNPNLCVSALSVPPTACDDVYVRDRITNRTVIASVSSSGAYANDTSFFPSLSGDGRYVAFSSYASNLVPGDTNGLPDAFVHDMKTRKTIRVSVSSSGAQGYVDKIPGILADPITLHELFPQAMISQDGRFVMFESRARGLVTPDADRCILATATPIHCRDVYVRDLVTGTTELVSDPGHGDRSNGDSFSASISADGRYVVFNADASNLTSDAVAPSVVHTYLRDRVTRTTTLISRSSNGTPANNHSVVHSITNQVSSEGRFVVFSSLASNLVPGDEGDLDIFVRDVRTGRTALASLSSSGAQGNGRDQGMRYSMSNDGRYVVFDSMASNLVPGDTNGVSDIFIRDLLTGATTRASLSSQGREGDGASRESCVSADGRVVVFSSTATDLVAGDTNGDQDIFIHVLPR